MESVYHLLYSDQNYTLCGFMVVKSDAQFDKAVHHMVDSVPIGRGVSKQCDKMNNRRKQVAESKARRALLQNFAHLSRPFTRHGRTSNEAQNL